jgi:hypothetical protein
MGRLLRGVRPSPASVAVFVDDGTIHACTRIREQGARSDPRINHTRPHTQSQMTAKAAMLQELKPAPLETRRLARSGARVAHCRQPQDAVKHLDFPVTESLRGLNQFARRCDHISASSPRRESSQFG